MNNLKKAQELKNGFLTNEDAFELGYITKPIYLKNKKKIKTKAQKLLAEVKKGCGE